MKQHTILIVDNEKSVANALKRVLWKENYRILSAYSGNEALTIMETFDCDLVLADQKMPKMMGIDLFKKIKKQYPKTKKILISAQINFEDLDKEVIDRFIPKPWDPQELKRIIKEELKDQGGLKG